MTSPHEHGAPASGPTNGTAGPAARSASTTAQAADAPAPGAGSTDRPAGPGPNAAEPASSPQLSFAALAQEAAANSGLQRKDNGQIDLLKAAGGWRGMAETVLPGLVYLVIYSLTQDLQPSIMGAVGISVLFVVARLVQKTPLTQALAGIFGVVISAVLSAVTGKAENFYVWGFVTNAGYIVALLASVLLRWPLLGLAFGYVRNEGLHWRHQPARLRAYAVATWIMIAVLGLRLVVQFPLFLAGQVEALGATRLIMGLPLYALGLWLAWLVSRPAATPSAATASAAGPAATPRAAEPGASPDAGTTAP